MDRRLRHRLMLAADPRFAFVPVGKLPAARGHRVVWLRTDSAIAFVACVYCGAPRMRPCIDQQGHAKTSTHATRRYAATALLRKRGVAT